MIEVRIHTSEFRDWLRRAGSDFQASAKQALGQSAGMAVEAAKTTTLFKRRTGQAHDNITRSPFGVWGWKIRATAKHAAYLEYGTRPHEIVARRAKALRFYWHGRLTFHRSVHHPGTKATHFLQRAADWGGDALSEMLARAANRSFR